MKMLARFTLLVLMSMVLAAKVHAATDVTTLTTDINGLIIQGNDLVAEMSTTSLTVFNLASSLQAIDASVGSMTNNVINVFNTLDGSASMSLTSELLISMQTLSGTMLTLSNQLIVLSTSVTTLAPLVGLSTLENSLASMLSLSSDIGTMANRIGEMADRILLMADNIGLMADRILATQIIQGDNVALTTDAILQTQKNSLALIAMFNL